MGPIIRLSGGEGEEENLIHKAIKEAATNKFVEQLKIVELINWKSKYIEPEVCDGTQWSVEITTEERTIRKHGDNMFLKEWEMFCTTIARITSKEFS